MQPDKEKALFIAEKVFAELVFDTQRMEGMPFTMPEVQTYIQGVTVGGHKVSDEAKLRRQILGWKRLIELVKTRRFEITKQTACELQGVIAEGEALEAGRFRSGQVGIAGSEHVPPAADTLDAVFESSIVAIMALDDVRERAYRLHLDLARNQFFWDGNKRTGLLLCNGHLLDNGYPPLSIPAKRLAEYNSGMLRFYESGEYGEMEAFLRECHEAMYRRFSEAGPEA